MGTNSQSQLDSDITIYSDYYSNVTTKTVQSIKEISDFIESSSFDLFHIFVDIDKEGNIYDSSQNKMPISTIANLMQESSAKYIVFAKDNQADGYIKGSEGLNQKANIVMTISRKGINFSDFFKKVFSKVSKGQSFPVTWNEIAPQVPNRSHDDSPETMAVMGAGNVVLLADK